MKNKVLITGGAGYIGSHLVLELLKQDFDLVVFDNFSTGHKETINSLLKINHFDFVEGDLKNKNDIENVFEKYNPNSVFHFAAFSQVPESVVNPQKYYDNNVCGSINLLNSMAKYDCKKIVFSSTAAVYGEPKYTLIDENHPKNPINPYGQTKIMIENIMDDYDKAYGIKSARLRYFNVIGASSSSVIGEWHTPETHLVASILISFLSKACDFKIFGNDYNTSDGTCIRDYIDINDLISAHILALKYLEKENKTNVFNLGTNNGITVLELFNIIQKTLNKKIPYEIIKRRMGDCERLVAQNNKAKEILNWKINHTIEDSIKSAYNWHKLNINR